MQTLKILPAIAAAFVFLLTRAFAADVNAADILRAVREGQSSRHESLNGQLRDDSNGKIYPFRLVADGPDVRYEFPGPPHTIVQVRYTGENSELKESSDAASAEKLTAATFDRKILGTDLTYEDLALRFVYWSRARLLESDEATTFPAYKLQLGAPSTRSQYAYVLLWVGKESGALLRAEGYDSDNHLIKRFEVVSGQKIEGRWYLKQMRIERINPQNGRVAARTYLEIKGATGNE